MELRQRDGSDALAYTSCYCEENVYRLVQQLTGAGWAAADHHGGEKHRYDASDVYAVFISNPDKSIPLWQHWDRVSNESRLVVWDYHVVVMVKRPSHSLAFDLDSALRFPCPFAEYAQEALRVDLDLAAQFVRRYRVVPAREFLAQFSSDRRHMRRQPGDPPGRDPEWRMPPPKWPCIHGRDARSEHELDVFIDMHRLGAGSGPGTVMGEAELVRMFSSATAED